jgi:hypothetical protein
MKHLAPRRSSDRMVWIPALRQESTVPRSMPVVVGSLLLHSMAIRYGLEPDRYYNLRDETAPWQF